MRTRFKEEMILKISQISKVAALAAVALAVAVPAMAQEVKPLGLSVRAGLFLPQSGAGKDQGKQWFGFGASYKIKDMEFGTYDRGYASQLDVSLDYYSKGDLSSMPVLANYVMRQNQIFYSVGAGVSFAKVYDNRPNTKNRMLFAYQLGVGYDFVQSQTPFFVEAKYFGTTKSELNGFGLYVGARF